MYWFCVADIDECVLAAVSGLRACRSDAVCENTPGSFSCLCPVGYVMAPDGQSCVGEVHVSVYVVPCVRPDGMNMELSEMTRNDL